jgi:hypothetical protein
VLVPEAARQRLHQAHRAGGELVFRRREQQLVEFAIGAHEAAVVVALHRRQEAPG